VRDLRLDDPRAQHPLDRTGQTDQPGQPLSAARIRDQTHAQLRVAVPVVALLADPQAARQRQLETTAHGVAVEGGDNDLGQSLQPVEDRLVPANDGRRIASSRRVADQARKLVHTVVGHETGVLRMRLDNDCPNGRVAPRLPLGPATDRG
jgi:hypothetical protein